MPQRVKKKMDYRETKNSSLRDIIIQSFNLPTSTLEKKSESTHDPNTWPRFKCGTLNLGDRKEIGRRLFRAHSGSVQEEEGKRREAGLGSSHS